MSQPGGRVVGIDDAVEIAAGVRRVCARRRRGDVVCWGDNEYGQLGDGTSTSRDTPESVPSVAAVVSLAADEYHTCATSVDGSVRCWGTLSRPVRSSLRNTAGRIQGLPDTQQISVGDLCAGATTSTGETWLWGLVPADGSPLDTSLHRVDIAGPLVRIDASYLLSCVLAGFGETTCWGACVAIPSPGHSPQECRQRQQTWVPPTAVPELRGVRAIAVSLMACALDPDARVRCWPDGVRNSLSPTRDPNDWSIRPVLGLDSVVQIDAAHYFTCALRSDGDVNCWGFEPDGGALRANMNATLVLRSSDLPPPDADAGP